MKTETGASVGDDRCDVDSGGRPGFRDCFVVDSHRVSLEDDIRSYHRRPSLLSLRSSLLL